MTNRRVIAGKGVPSAALGMTASKGVFWRWRFHVPLRRCDFYDDRALCRDVRRKLELWLDPPVLHTLWDRTWNQWKHLLGTKIEVEGTFVQSGKYRKGREQWELARRESHRLRAPVAGK